MKRLVLPSVVALALMAATPTVSAADAKEQLKELVDTVKTKLAAGKRTEAELAEDLKKFDAILEEHKGEKTDDVAQVLMMKAMLYAEVLGNEEKGVELLKKLQAEFPETAVAKQAGTAVATLERQASVAVGKQFPDFEVKDLEGKPLSVSQFKGKHVLVDFWATWCGPCIQELPNLQKAYEKYHGKGFEIIGISLDREEEKLTSFIKENKMAWPQHFDAKGEVAQKYGITGIPATYLLDGEGKIIAKGLRGDALETKLAEALK